MTDKQNYFTYTDTTSDSNDKTMENLHKQIMINGCDVSGCDFYDKNKKYCLTLKMDTTGFKNPSCFSGDFQECIQDSKVCPYTFCDNNPNCYYKQLKRKEQELEQYKQILNEIKEIAEHCITQDICTFCDNSDKCYIEDEAIPTYDVCKLILQKISECEGNDG